VNFKKLFFYGAVITGTAVSAISAFAGATPIIQISPVTVYSDGTLEKGPAYKSAQALLKAWGKGHESLAKAILNEQTPAERFQLLLEHRAELKGLLGVDVSLIRPATAPKRPKGGADVKAEDVAAPTSVDETAEKAKETLRGSSKWTPAAEHFYQLIKKDRAARRIQSNWRGYISRKYGGVDVKVFRNDDEMRALATLVGTAQRKVLDEISRGDLRREDKVALMKLENEMAAHEAAYEAMHQQSVAPHMGPKNAKYKAMFEAYEGEPEDRGEPKDKGDYQAAKKKWMERHSSSKASSQRMLKALENEFPTEVAAERQSTRDIESKFKSY